jgi:hypothetical protein
MAYNALGCLAWDFSSLFCEVFVSRPPALVEFGTFYVFEKARMTPEYFTKSSLGIISDDNI